MGAPECRHLEERLWSTLLFSPNRVQFALEGSDALNTENQAMEQSGVKGQLYLYVGQIMLSLIPRRYGRLWPGRHQYSTDINSRASQLAEPGRERGNKIISLSNQEGRETEQRISHERQGNVGVRNDWQTGEKRPEGRKEGDQRTTKKWETNYIMNHPGNVL